ncbi:hypothetical protein [Exiguobacterium acetylicum]|uniref:DUF3899 domain-containing protein n=1 Tax=Exiguobacterium acetylicum TaxID=41170 RepID=A0ABX8GE88_EXIAC|nr:hypothetical protein [Exiguobacterium acetylicum]QWB31970.1 hypothetical protein KKI46_17575 [Exiguobacterium acetylicum]
MNWFTLNLIVASIFTVLSFVCLLTIIVLKIKYGFSLEKNLGTTKGEEISSSKNLDWSDKKIQFFHTVYFFIRLVTLPIVIVGMLGLWLKYLLNHYL